jgi:hypothetical protein
MALAQSGPLVCEISVITLTLVAAGRLGRDVVMNDRGGFLKKPDADRSWTS